MFSYPYIQDDWIHIYYFSSPENQIDLFNSAATFFTNSDETFYRPLGKLYFYFIVRTFGANPIGFRVIDLGLVFCTAIILKAVAFHMLRNNTLAWFSGAWYVFSSTVLMDPLMWMAGMYDLAGVFFFLLSILLFLKKKRWQSAFFYFVAILFKEGPIVLPVVLFLHAFLLGEQASLGWRKILLSMRGILPHLIGLLGYFLLRFNAILAGLGAAETKAYKIDFWGMHVFTNILKYLVWTIEGLTGLANLNENRLYLLLILLIGTTLSFVLWKSVWRDASNRNILFSKSAENFSLILFFILWGIFCILPVLFLPNHAYRYYGIYSFPAFILIMGLCIDLVLQFYCRKTAILTVALLFIYFSNFATFNLFLGKGLRAPVLSGSNALVQRGETVKLMLACVRHELKKPPDNAVFVFDGVNRRTTLYQGIDPFAFRGKNFLRYVYRDPSIWVIDLRGRFFGDLKRVKDLNLNPLKTVVLGLQEGKIQRYAVEDIYDRDSGFYSNRKLLTRQR